MRFPISFLMVFLALLRARFAVYVNGSRCNSRSRSLRDVEDLSYEEIGEITGLAEGTVKSRIHRARGMLKKALERVTGDRLR